MKDFFEGIRIAERQLSDILGSYGIDISPREAAFVLATIFTLLCSLATFISVGTITGENTIFGKKYGKFDSKKAKKKKTFFWIAIVFASLAGLVFILDGFANFTNIAMFFPYIKAIFLCIIIEAVALFFGGLKSAVKEDGRDKKYKRQIDEILDNNPIYVDAIKRIKKDNKIKMVIIYRDGISFHDKVDIPSDNKEEEISYYDKHFHETEKNKALETVGSVTHSTSKNVIKFSDYKYRNSESAMQDLCKYIHHATAPRFKRINYTKSFIYREAVVCSGPTGAIVNGDRVTFTGYSSKDGEVKSSGNVVIYCILYDDTPVQYEDNSFKNW